MNPEFLPELLVLFAGVVFAGVALNRLFERRFLRGLGFAGLSVACVGLAILSGRYAHRSYDAMWRLPVKPPILLPRSRSDPLEKGSASPTFTVVLGGVPVQLAAADHHAFSVSGEEFLALDSRGSGLSVSCDVAGWQNIPVRAPMLAAHLVNNRVLSCAPGVRSTFPDANTILIQEDGKDILRIHYLDPHRVAVDGEFYLSEDSSPGKITFVDGIRWAHGRIDPGSGLDLRPQGAGRVDFMNSGAIQVLRK